MNQSGFHHSFGGTWTEKKLKVVADYLRAYTIALKDKPNPYNPFRKAYIDAFAGTGYIDLQTTLNQYGDCESIKFSELIEPEPQTLLEGSTRQALYINPPFDKYIFIEKRAKWVEQLETMKLEFSDRSDNIEIRKGEANYEIKELCSKNWKSHRAVLFLDPYGMQVEWDTIEAIASTEAIDLWLLFPLGIAVNRMLPKTGIIPENWRLSLNKLFGTEEWFEKFYKPDNNPTLFGDKSNKFIKADMKTISDYFISRLRDTFHGVAGTPGILRNSSNSPLYLLCFAVSNKNGVKPALKIANSLLRKLR